MQKYIVTTSINIACQKRCYRIFCTLFVLMKNKEFLSDNECNLHLTIYASNKRYDNRKEVSSSLSGQSKQIECKREQFSHRKRMHMGFVRKIFAMKGKNHFTSIIKYGLSKSEQILKSSVNVNGEKVDCRTAVTSRFISFMHPRDVGTSS